MKKKKENIKRLILLDAHAIIHRAYHALPDFATASGEPTGALYGICTMLIKIIEDLKPDYIIACFDLPGPTHRHEAYDAYKGGRAKTEDNLVIQLERAKDLFKAWGIPIYSEPGFEADDILGTIVELVKKDKGIQTIIASGDMDTLQLVRGEEVVVYTLKKGINDTILYDEKAVMARFNFKPLLLPDYKGLRGDPSDNIIGVKGIGEKTATNLITAFGTVENIYKNLKKKDETYKQAGINERVRNLLIDNEEEALFSKTLATIRRDAPIDFKLPEDWRKCLDMNTLLDLFRVLEFRTMGDRVKRLIDPAGAAKVGSSNTNSAVLTHSKLRAPTPDRISTTLTEEVAKIPESRETKELRLMLWIIDSNVGDPTLDDVFQFTKTESLEEAKKVLEAELEKRNLKKVYEDIEKPLIDVVERMNATGVKIDRKMLGELSRDYHKQLEALEKSIWKDAGEEFNINSPKVLSQILFDKLGLGEKKQKKTPGGAISTKESELEKIKDKHPIIERVLSYRELQKLLSTYIDAIPPQLDKDSRLHSTFEQWGTTTGRMSSNNPNLQNIPIKSELGRAIRKAFIAEEGFSLVGLDYSQIELRIAAILSEDLMLVDIFKNGEDVHTGVASRVFKVAPEEVDKEMRRKAKVINFGILFGMGVSALKINLGTDRATAQEFYNEYFETFKGLSGYLDKVKAEAKRTGYTETLFGRRRYFGGFKSPLPFIRAQAERMAINAPIQGTEADIVKISMKEADELIISKGWQDDVRLLLNVHDEIVYEVKDELAEEVAKEFKKIMESVIPKDKTCDVPIISESSIGKNWGEMK